MQDKIIEALRRNAADEATALARQWVEAEPKQSQAHRWLALALQQQGHNAESLAALDQALSLAPEDADLHLQRAGLLLATRQLQDAGTELARTTELDPNQFNAYVMQAHLALAKGDLDEAERVSRVASRLEPDHVQLALVDGLVALRRGDVDRSLGLLSAASAQLPDDPRVLYAVGLAYLAKDHLAFAEHAFRRVMEVAPVAATPALWALIAQLSFRQGQPDAAAEAMERVLALPGGDVPAMRRLAGEAHLEAGRPAEAVAHLRLVLAVAPDDQRTLQALLAAWQRLGTEDDARQTVEEQLERNPGLHALWLARLAIEPVGSDAALAVIERWTEAMPGHLPALEALMRISDMRKDPAAAEATARRIIALEPGRISAEQRIVQALLERDPAAAVAHVQAIVDKAPPENNAPLRSWLGAVQERAGDYAGAIATWVALHNDLAPNRLPLPPQARSPASWPELAPIDESHTARPLFIWGAPGSGVERVVQMMAARSQAVRGDRFAGNPPDDPFQNYKTLQRLATDELDPVELVQQWRDQLPARGIQDGNIVDWLLWWDNALLWALRPQLPEARLVVVLRDPRDMLIEWLALGAPAPLALTSVQQAAEWLARVMVQVAILHEQDLYPSMLLRIDDAANDPRTMAELMQHAFNLPFPQLRSLGPTTIEGGHWRKYADVLAPAFALLTPVAVRLGYPEA